MVLVDYSESDASGSESEAAPAPAPAPRPAAGPRKQPFHKVVDRSNRGKVVVSLPQPQAAPASDEPPAKRARTSGATLFSGFNSMLPPPKNTPRAAPSGVTLKTSAEPGFRRPADEMAAGAGGGGVGEDEALRGASPDRAAEASVSREQKPADEVRLVGKPLMFRPLSVARTAKKKKNVKVGLAKTEPNAAAQPSSSASDSPHPKKMSLFSLHAEEPQEPATTASGATYVPLFEPGPQSEPALDHHAQHTAQALPATKGAGADSLDSITDDLRLSAAARRELFGREGGARAAKQVINFNTDQEYLHNEKLRAAGEQQIHQPVRALQGGKHSLRQLVQNVHNQREALEDSFANGKSNRKEASSRYGW